MLLQLGLVDADDVRPFDEEFTKMDKDGSGKLDKADLEEVRLPAHFPLGLPL